MAWLLALSRLPVGSSASTIAGSADEGPGDRDPLALAAGQLGRAGARPRGEARPGQSVGGPLRGARRGDPGVEQPVGDVVERALVLGEEELLEDEADPGRPQRDELPVATAGDVEAGDADRARGRPVEGAHQVEQRRLARARRPDDGRRARPFTVKLTPRSA